MPVQIPLLPKRWLAWMMEVSLIAVSAAVPFQAGLYTQSLTTERVPLNPMLSLVEETAARTLALPVDEKRRLVAPLTNLFWSVALLTPVAIAGFNFYLLSRTGQTLPKQWLGIRVTTLSGNSPGVWRILLREPLGRWSVPLGIAYLIWRYSGAFPDLGILAGLSGLLLLGEGMSAHFNAGRRALRDRLAGTVVGEVALPADYGGQSQTYYAETQTLWEAHPDWTDEDVEIAAIVLTPEPMPRRENWFWWSRSPVVLLLLVTSAGLLLILGTFVGVQIYIQSQTNQREYKNQDNQVFLTLVSRLGSSTGVEDRRGAILALGTVNDERALPLLADLLSQETVPALLDATQQALVSRGPSALPYLKRLNQSLKNDLDSLRGQNLQQQTLLLRRQQSAQRAIAKILTIYSGQVRSVDLNRSDLGQTNTEVAQFNLVLDQVDLAGIQFRGAILTGASFRGTRFYGPGEDERLGTFDDWIANLNGADLKYANLSGALLSNVSMVRTNLIKATLNKANLSSAQLPGANLSSARLVETNLREANLEGASLTGADLGQSNLMGANLNTARLGQVSAIGAKFQAAKLVDTDWQGADLSGANFIQSNLQRANFSSAKLAGTDFRYAQLQNTNFRNADLSLTDLRGSELEGADFDGAIFFASTPADPASNQFIKTAPVTGQTTLLRGVNFARVRNLTTEQISYLCAQGALHPRCH